MTIEIQIWTMQMAAGLDREEPKVEQILMIQLKHDYHINVAIIVKVNKWVKNKESHGVQEERRVLLAKKKRKRVGLGGHATTLNLQPTLRELSEESLKPRISMFQSTELRSLLIFNKRKYYARLGGHATILNL